MTADSPVLKVVLIVFAIIGALTVLAFVGMAFMHGSMMGRIGTFSEIAAACQGMMSARL